MENLPNELLDEILTSLPVADCVSLWRSSAMFADTIRNHLFRPAQVDETMRYACVAGDVGLIRDVVSHGADPSYFTLRRSVRRSPKSSPLEDPVQGIKVSTLGLALRRGRSEAFETLAELGARFGELGDQDIRVLCRFLDHPRPSALVQRLVEVGFRAFYLDRDVGSKVLVHCMQNGLPRELIERLLEQGVSPNPIIRPNDDGSGTPVNGVMAAMESGSLDLVNLVVRHGGWLTYSDDWSCNDFPRIRYDVGSPTRVYPIIEAARHMGRTGSMEMMDLCLLNSANVNWVMAEGVEDTSIYRTSGGGIHSYRTISPLTAFLEACDSLERLSWGVSHFRLRYANFAATEKPIKNKAIYHRDKWWPSRDLSFSCVSAIDILLDKWGVQAFQEQQFAETMRLLWDKGAGRGNVDAMLNKYCVDHPESRDDPSNLAPAAWWDFVEMLSDHLRDKTVRQNCHRLGISRGLDASS